MLPAFLFLTKKRAEALQAAGCLPASGWVWGPGCSCHCRLQPDGPNHVSLQGSILEGLILMAGVEERAVSGHA